ncbi:MAG: T9SS type A sorting domain-containing protein [Bacteroidetes bacterium]|nr:T9SS type A sorting domain-containing protein [Bacteroidota bacterium]
MIKHIQLPYGIYYVRLKINSIVKTGRFIRTNTAGINESTLTDNSTIIYPNPAKGIVNINLPYLSECLFYDITGTLIKISNTINSSIDISEIPNGIYFLEITLSNGSKVKKKLVKQD